MSGRLIGCAVRKAVDLDLDLVDKMALVCLAEDARDTREGRPDRLAMPGLDELQRWCSRGPTTVWAAVARLVEFELIAQVEYGRLGHRAVYLVLPHGCDTCSHHPPIAFTGLKPKGSGRKKASAPKKPTMLSLSDSDAFSPDAPNPELLSPWTESPPELPTSVLPTSRAEISPEVPAPLTNPTDATTDRRAATR